MKIIPRLCFALAFVLLTHGIAVAQAFNTERIKVGQKVYVRDLAGAETKGVVQSVDASKLVVKFGAGTFPDPTDPSRALNDTRTFSPADVDRVRRPGSIWDGAVKGALVGLIPVIVASAAECYGCDLGPAMAAMVAAGAGIGLGIDAAWGPKTVYRNPGVSGRVTVIPVISRDRRGLAASIRF